MGLGAVSLDPMSFWLRIVTAFAVMVGVLAPVSASGAQTLAQVQAKIRQLEEDATAAAEGAQEAKVKLAGLTKTLNGIKAKAEIQGQSVAALQKSLVAINKELGTASSLNGELLKDFTQLTTVAGYTEEAALGLSRITLATGTDLSNNTSEIFPVASGDKIAVIKDSGVTNCTISVTELL